VGKSAISEAAILHSGVITSLEL